MAGNGQDGTQATGRDKDIREAFLKAGFNHYPEAEVYKSMLGRARLGNMTFVSSLL